MASFDTHKNFGYSTVASGSVIGSTSGTSLTLATGDGSKFATSQNISVWPANSLALSNNAEIMRITGISTDTLTVTRAQEGSSALSNIVAGYQVANSITSKVFTDIENSLTSRTTIITVAPTGTQADYNTTGTNDDVVFQTAVNALIAAGGGTLKARAGTYSLGHEILIVGSNIIFEGEGNATIFNLQNQVNREMIVVGDASTSCNNIIIRNMFLNGNASNQTAGSLYAGGTRNLIRLRCDAQNCYYMLVEGVYAYNGKQNGISVESASYTTVRHNRSSTMGNFGIWWENSSNVVIQDNFTELNTLGGIKLLSCGAGAVMNNVSKSDFGGSFLAQQAGSTSFIGNQAYRSGWSTITTAPASGFGFSGCSNISVQGNTAYGTYGDGMGVNGVTYSSFIGNTFRRCGQFTNNTYSDIVLTNAGGGSNNHDNQFIGNTFQNDTATFYTNAAQYNINIAQVNSHTGNIFRDNTFGSPVTAKTNNLLVTDGTPGNDDNSLGFNRNLNPQKMYSYGYLSSSPFTIDPANGDTLVGTGYLSNCLVNINNGLIKGQSFSFRFSQDVGNKQLTWGANVIWPGGNAPVFSGVANTSDTMSFVWDGANWYGSIGFGNTNVNVYSSLTVNNSGGYASNVLAGQNGNLSILAGGSNDSTNYIESANAAKNANQSLKLTGLFAGLGTNLFLKFANTIFGSDVAGANSTVQVVGSLATNYIAVAGVYSILSTDSIVDCTMGPYTVTLPTAASITGRKYTIKNSGAGTITIATTSSQKIDGLSTSTLLPQYSAVQLISDGVNWKIVSVLAAQANLFAIGVSDTVRSAELINNTPMPVTSDSIVTSESVTIVEA